ncbi:UDP-N-acetylenolpyruvoylglucosamine reductase [Halotalea alkalilenta]|uniref:UDP-N-acetylenolpyruvoylglucosamine reductase n=1 Tax=Halotalea alkalilenta TaxID=376489 RepID=A0A172YFG9_9GAMM|nr:UDP-N-acetylenolpyruvoylglucosamine reductase [Halotalea alkalilenta]
MAASLKIIANAPLDAANTLGFSAFAEWLVRPADLAELRGSLALARRSGWPVTLLGGGSNVVLFPRLEGLVVIPSGVRRWFEIDGEEARLHVEAGVDWPTLVEEVARAGWWGLENLALIPGRAGAAPVQNIGAYGVELADCLEAVHVVDLADGRYRVMARDACGFGYRESRFKNELSGRVAIVRLVLRVSRKARAKLGYGDLAERAAGAVHPLQVVEAVSAIRREKLPDPARLANVGSFFKNPVVSLEQAERLRVEHPQLPCYPAQGGVKLAAGWLIEHCGFKGTRSAAFGVHDRQALVLVHFGGGKACELIAFAARISAEVERRFGVRLEPEPRRLGQEVSPGLVV